MKKISLFLITLLLSSNLFAGIKITFGGGHKAKIHLFSSNKMEDMRNKRIKRIQYISMGVLLVGGFAGFNYMQKNYWNEPNLPDHNKTAVW